MKQAPRKSPYTVLGVQPDATKKEIELAYRRKAMQLHPDRNSAPDALDRFREMRQCYELLISPVSREMVDRMFGFSSRGGARAAPSPDAPPAAGHKEVDFSSYAGPAAAGDYDEKFDLGANYSLLALLVHVLHLQNIPLKTIVCFPVIALIHYEIIRFRGMQAQLPLEFIFFQSLAVAAVGEIVIAFASMCYRWTVRRVVNGLVCWAIALSVLFWSGSLFLNALALTQVHIELVQDVSLLGVIASAYAWLVLCFTFQRHDPTWEVLLIWAGIAGLAVVVINLGYAFEAPLIAPMMKG